MGTKTNQHTFKVFLFLAGLLAISNHSYGTELIELNRVVAKVNERIVTWGEIENAMTLLNFTDQEKKLRANQFVDGKVDRLLSIAAFGEKGMQIPTSYIEQEYNKRLIRDFNGDRKLFRDTLRSKGLSQLEYRKEIEEEIESIKRLYLKVKESFCLCTFILFSSIISIFSLYISKVFCSNSFLVFTNISSASF